MKLYKGIIGITFTLTASLFEMNCCYSEKQIMWLWKTAGLQPYLLGGNCLSMLVYQNTAAQAAWSLYYRVSTKTLYTFFLRFLSILCTLVKNSICFLYVHSILCWKMSKIFDFELKLTKLQRKAWGWSKIKVHKIL